MLGQHFLRKHFVRHRVDAPPQFRQRIDTHGVEPCWLGAVMAVLALLNAARPAIAITSLYPSALARRFRQPEMSPRVAVFRVFDHTTKAPGVKIPEQLIEQFPEEMTIVIQHQYWDLEVHDGHFEIILKFNRVPQHLSIPYVAMTRFVDPAVNFGVSFEKGETLEDDASVVDPALATADGDTANSTEDSGSDGETVVSLDAFRRK